MAIRNTLWGLFYADGLQRPSAKIILWKRLSVVIACVGDISALGAESIDIEVADKYACVLTKCIRNDGEGI